MSMGSLLTIWLPVGFTALAAWIIHRPRPVTMASGLQALERLVGVPEPLPALVRLVEWGRPDLRLVPDEGAIRPRSAAGHAGCDQLAD